MPLRAPTEGAYAAMAMYLLPAGLVGLVLVAICASTMSTLDLSLTGLAGLITQNIYPALSRRLGVKPWEGRARLILGRVVNLCCALAIITIALIMARLGSGGVFNLMMKIIAQVMAPISVPMMWGMFVRRVPNWATPLSIVVGFVVSSGIEYGPGLLGSAPWLYHEQIFALFAASTLAFLGACWVYRRGAPDPEIVAREAEFFSRWSSPVNFTAEIGQGNDGRQMRIVGRFGLAMAAAILLLLIPASSAGHSGKILVIAGGTAVVGGVLRYFGRANRTT
jgi:Na+/proline symporter